MIDENEDTWVIPHIGRRNVLLDFDFLPTPWFKSNVKRYTKDLLQGKGNLKLRTLRNYNSDLRIFFDFVREYEIRLETFKDITFEVTSMFVQYLGKRYKKASTRRGPVKALKHILRYGRIFNLSGYPQNDVFHGYRFKNIKYEDKLETKLIPNYVMKQIKMAVEYIQNSPKSTYKEKMTACLVTICMYTGLRVSEALMLDEDCIKKWMGQPYLDVISEKNETERFIAVGNEVEKSIQILKKLSQSVRQELGTKRLFVFQGMYSKLRLVTSEKATSWLKDKLLTPYSIQDENGKSYPLHYHQFRHTLATDMLNNGMIVLEVAQVLGHETLHTTKHFYALVRNSNVKKSIQKLGFVGLIVKSEDVIIAGEQKIESSTRLKATLPDGLCNRPIYEKVEKCKKPNACLFCEKFITTPDFLSIHKEHLARLRKDKELYKLENMIGTDFVIDETENVLEEIIMRLDRLVGNGA
ncbi:Site-specific recombinase XerD [Aneurinibacillus migulanus]|nr:Site-specific recombinase XerD [Aneurinibacillus migulanus]